MDRRVEEDELCKLYRFFSCFGIDETSRCNKLHIFYRGALESIIAVSNFISLVSTKVPRGVIVMPCLLLSPMHCQKSCTWNQYPIISSEMVRYHSRNVRVGLEEERDEEQLRD